MRNNSTKRRRRCAPLGLMVFAPDHVEGFTPMSSRQKRPRRPTATPLKLLPLQLASTSPGGFNDSSPIDRRPTTEPGESSCRDNGQRASSSGRGGGARRARGVGGSKHSTGAVTSPSFDILNCDYWRAGSDMAVIEPIETGAFPASVTMHSASGSLVVKEGEQVRETRLDNIRTAKTSREAEEAEKVVMFGGGAESDDTFAVEVPANTPNVKGGDTEEFRDRGEGRAHYGRKGTRKEKEEAGDADGDKAEYGHDESGGYVAPTSGKATIKGIRSGMMTEKDYSDVVLPLALPGEAHGMYFRAAARAVVLVSGSSRFMITRHIRGRTLSSRVKLPWVPPLEPPWRTITEGRPGEERRPKEARQQQRWELHHAATQIQRVWRGYLARAAFWTEGGVGLHAVATRIQRVFRGWRGKIHAAETLVQKRARAAALITGLGRGFQGRQEARQLRVCRCNAAAVIIQGHYRARAVRSRWLDQLALAKAVRCAGQIQACWRGFAARRRFHVVGSGHSMEEEALKAVCLSYAGRGGWSEKFESELESEAPARTGRMMRTPAFPEDFAARFDFSSRDKFAGNSIIRDDPNPQHEVSAANGEQRESRLSSRGTSSDFVGRPSISGVFGGAFFSSSVPRIQGCPKKFDCGKQLDGCSAAAFASATDVGEGGGGSPGAPAVTAALAMNSAVKPPSPPSERYYVAYGHCLLAGAGTGARDEATEAAATAVGQCDGILGPSKIGDFGSVSSRARTSARRRTRGYGDALEIFQEGLRRFPTSTALLYGASLAMQASWFTDNLGASPTAAMLEASLHLLNRAWEQDPDRRAYQQAEAFFLAAARIARRRLLNAETAAAAARQARLARLKKLKKTTSAAGADEAGGTLGMVALGLLEGEGEDGSEESDEEQEEQTEDVGNQKVQDDEEEEQGEPEEVTVCKKAAAVAALHVALWSQIANGNQDMDLRRAETMAAYRRTRKLYSRALELASAGAVQEIGSSECTFMALYRVKSKLLVTRHLRLELPPHPDPLPTEESESGGNATNDEKSPGGHATADPAKVERRQQEQKVQQQQRLEQEQEQEQEEQEEQQEQQQQQQQHEEQLQEGQRQHGKYEQTKELRRQQQLLESTLENTALSRKTLGARSTQRAPRWIASKIITVVREGTRMIIRQTPFSSPRNSPRSPGSWSPRIWSPRSLSLRQAGRDKVEGKGSGGIFSPRNGEVVENPIANSPVGNMIGSLANSPTDHPANCLAVTGPAEISAELTMQEKQHQRRVQLYLEAEVCTISLHSSSAGRNKREYVAASIAKTVTVPATSLRVTVTSWRCGAKLMVRVKERDIVNGVGSEDDRGGDAGAGLDTKQAEEKTSKKNVEERQQTRRKAPPLLGEGGCVIVVHEAEMERLVVAAVEEQVAGGRPRDIVEATEPFRLVSEHFIGKVVLLPECDEDLRYRFSSSRSIGGRKGGFAVGLGRFAAGLPYLDAIRKQQAEESARHEGARVLQRAFGGLLARAKCRFVCYRLLAAIEEIREQGRRLLEEDVLRQRESDAARHIQGAWKGWKLRARLSQLKSAAKLVGRCFRRLEAKRAAEKAERNRLEGPEVLTVYHRGTVVSGVPLMLSVLRCGHSYKFVGRDQEACWAHHGYCYDKKFRVVNILQEHNRRYARGHKGDTFMTGRVGRIDPSRTKKIVEMLVSRLALVDALPAPTAELRGQHRYKTLVVQTTDLSPTEDILSSAGTGTAEDANGPVSGDSMDQRSLRGPGILAVGAEHGRGLRDTRAMITKSLKRYHKRQARWEESRRKQAYMQHHQNKSAAAQD
ncbi:unnamed protein product [Pylaiella littoralis]